MLGEGDYYGQPFRLRPQQKRWIHRLYEYYPETGNRRYRRALKGVAKGNGKSPEAGAIGGYEFMGGVNLSPRVMIGAASLKQANVVFGDLKTGATESPTLRDHVLPFELEMQLVDGPGIVERLAAEAATNDGGRATCFIADELHEWLGRVARMFLVVDGAIAKRQNAFTMGISTAGVLSNPPSLLQELYEHGVAVSNGELVDDQFLFEWYEADPELDLDDEQQWLEAVMQANPAAGDYVSVENLRYRFETIPRFEFERYHLNRWTTTAVQWLPGGAWDGCETEGEIAREVSLAFKGSYSNDRAALVACDSEGRLEVLAWFEERNQGDVVAPEEVDLEVAKAFERFKVHRMVCVRTGWHTQVEQWSERYGADVVIAYPINSKVKRAEACSKFYTAVVNQQVSHDGDPRLARQLSEAVVRNTEQGAYIVEDSGRAIELASCAVMAYEQATATDVEPEVATLVTF